MTNGTSTANKIVWHGTVARGDVVFVDRNCRGPRYVVEVLKS